MRYPVIYWLCRFSFVLCFIMSKNKRGCVLNYYKMKSQTLCVFIWHDKTQEEKVAMKSKIISSKTVFSRLSISASVYKIFRGDGPLTPLLPVPLCLKWMLHPDHILVCQNVFRVVARSKNRHSDPVFWHFFFFSSK